MNSVNLSVVKVKAYSRACLFKLLLKGIFKRRIPGTFAFLSLDLRVGSFSVGENRWSTFLLLDFSFEVLRRHTCFSSPSSGSCEAHLHVQICNHCWSVTLMLFHLSCHQRFKYLWLRLLFRKPALVFGEGADGIQFLCFSGAAVLI